MDRICEALEHRHEQHSCSAFAPCFSSLCARCQRTQCRLNDMFSRGTVLYGARVSTRMLSETTRTTRQSARNNGEARSLLLIPPSQTQACISGGEYHRPSRLPSWMNQACNKGY